MPCLDAFTGRRRIEESEVIERKSSHSDHGSFRDSMIAFSWNGGPCARM